MSYTQKQLIDEAKGIYDVVCDRAMESGRDLPWWSELDETTANSYIERARRVLDRRAQITEALKGFTFDEVLAWVHNHEEYR